MEQQFTVRTVRAGTIYKLLLLGLLLSMVPLSTLMGIAALFGADTVKWNGEPLHGWLGLLASPFLGIFIALLFTGFVGTLTCLGLWLLSWFRPIKLRVVQMADGVPDE